MVRRAAGLTNGLAVSDDQPLDYFFRYARYHFDAKDDLATAEERGAPHIEQEYLRYFAYAWREMARSQANKYGPLIEKHPKGKELLELLGFLTVIDFPVKKGK